MSNGLATTFKPQRRRYDPSFRLTPLNRAVNRLYAKCLVKGHVRSGVLLEREVNGVLWAFDVCERCGCPVNRRAAITGWGDQIIEKGAA